MTNDVLLGGPALTVGDLLGSWRVEELLGRGRFASVYRVRSIDLPSRVAAAKVVRAADRDRLAAEAEVLRRLDHPGVPRLLDTALEVSTPYLLVALVTGTTLRQRLREGGRLEPVYALPLALDLAAALEHAHARGVVHGDIKPENILVATDGRARLVDFGQLSRMDDAPSTGVLASRDLASATVASVAFDPAYAAPEVLGRSAPTTRSDVFAFGVVLFECLTGERPQHGELLSARVPGIPSSLVDLVARCLGRPEGRFSDGRDLWRALASLRESTDDETQQPSRTLLSWARRGVALDDGVCPTCRRATTLGAGKCQHCGLDLTRRRPALACVSRAEEAWAQARWSDASAAAAEALAADAQVPRAATILREAEERQARMLVLTQRAGVLEALGLHATAVMVLGELEATSPIALPPAAQDAPRVRARAAAVRTWHEGLVAWRLDREDAARTTFNLAREQDQTLVIRQLAAPPKSAREGARRALLEAFVQRVAKDAEAEAVRLASLPAGGAAASPKVVTNRPDKRVPLSTLRSNPAPSSRFGTPMVMLGVVLLVLVVAIASRSAFLTATPMADTPVRPGPAREGAGQTTEGPRASRGDPSDRLMPVPTPSTPTSIVPERPAAPERPAVTATVAGEDATTAERRVEAARLADALARVAWTRDEVPPERLGDAISALEALPGDADEEGWTTPRLEALRELSRLRSAVAWTMDPVPDSEAKAALAALDAHARQDREWAGPRLKVLRTQACDHDLAELGRLVLGEDQPGERKWSACERFEATWADLAPIQRQRLVELKEQAAAQAGRGWELQELPSRVRRGAAPGLYLLDLPGPNGEAIELVALARPSTLAVGRYEVSREQYSCYMDSSAGLPAPPWEPEPGEPVVGVSWEEARRFAASAGGRLPTQAEWRVIAAGGSYPWGEEEPSPERCVWAGHPTHGKRKPSPGRSASGQPSRPGGASRAGVFDLAGNVWEWCNTALPDGRKVIMGGGWRSEARQCAIGKPSGLNATTRDATVGFRIVVELQRGKR